MRIRYKVALVGGIPITIAAAIAVAAWLLLNEAERARKGAVLAGGAYRTLAGLTTARDESVGAFPLDRDRHAGRFAEVAAEAERHLGGLAGVARNERHRAAAIETRAALQRYREQMAELRLLIERNDQLIREMNERAETLVALADKARERQHQSNADIVASLADGDRKLRVARDIVDRAYATREAATALELERLRGASDGEAAQRPATPSSFATARLRNAAGDLAELLREHRPVQALELAALLRGAEAASPDPGLGGWLERLVKINATEQRALHEEVAQLLTYSVQAAETEQATQTIAIATLKLAQRAADALAGRDANATAAISGEGRLLAERVGALPISPLIQAEMVEAIERWRERLATTGEGLRQQNGIVTAQNATAAAMIQGAGALNDLFTAEADRIGGFVRTILALGAALGLLLGSGTAYVVARSITRPLLALQSRMIELASHPVVGSMPEARRRDELGAMARAVRLFVSEIVEREAALRRAKEQADATLAELREAQSSLIQAEKLASLGQLVAGIAHEINTPLGVALTTSTALDREVKRLDGQVVQGRMLRSDLVRTIERLNEGSRLLFSNLTRAVDLVYSFKQVAADRASGERRSFELKAWLHEVVTSLGPALRQAGHAIDVQCPDGLVLDSYPGALAQVLTNLVMNSIAHAYPDGRSGHLTLAVDTPGPGVVRFTYADDGVGIAAEHQGRVFDPFFTTGRDRGSTGLGLHIVYNLVTATLQGRIDIDSRAGGGTRFLIEFPLRAASAEPAALALSA